jgi:DNA helicase-2/ATP-dependent DNA helicase PcrA
MEPSLQQLAVLDFVRNKNIATELQQRLPSHVQAKTFHSQCFGALQRALPKRPQVNENKVWNLLRDDLTKKDFEIYGKFAARLVSYGKNCGVGHILTNDTLTWQSLIDHFALFIGVDDSDEQVGIEIAERILRDSNEQLDIIDFDDMLYLALLKNVHFDKWNYIMLDEAQDTNGVQRELLKRMLALPPNGRLIAVGDSYQSIYGFRGASAEAMEELADDFTCESFPLSVSYRCAQEVVLETNREIPGSIDAHPTAPIGSVEKLNDYDLENFDSTSAILCRVTAPLVTLAFGFIKRNTGVRILGREIGAGLVALVKKMNTRDVDVLSDKLRNWRAREVGKALNRGHESAAAAIDDKYSCLMVFIDQLNEDERTVDELIRRIESLFSDNNRGLLTLCSVHKAKGLEWPTVFILDRDEYMPSKWAKQEWQRKQETNLIYVAITRAKLHLRYIKSDKWRKAKTEAKVDDVEAKRKELLETI